jgi:hypothetical protein
MLLHKIRFAITGLLADLRPPNFRSSVMAIPVIKKFIFSAQVNDAEVLFDMHPVNIREKQLYQVYTQHNNAPVRFHMQATDGVNFKITDRNTCPPAYIALEQALSDAIGIN